MATINKRVFGTPITGVVRDKLEARQGETKNLQAGESLTLHLKTCLLIGSLTI